MTNPVNTVLTAGSGISIIENISASTVSIHSTYENKRTVVIPLNTATPLSGTEVNYVPIPATMNGWKLFTGTASCSGSSTSGSPSFTVKRSSASSLTQINMLLNNITIDQGEYDSSTSASPMSVSTSASTVYTGDKVWVASSGSSTCGTNTTGVDISLTFQNLA